MKVGLAGFAGSGKSTVFLWLTGVKPDPAASQRGQIGIAKITDERLAWLSSTFKPKKTIAATLEITDTPGLMADERRDNARRLGLLRESDGLAVVLNGYANEDWAAELQRFREELLFADLEIVSNRVGKLEDQMKKPKPTKEREADQVELALLQRIVAAFEAGKPASAVGLKEDEEKAIRSFQLLTLKPEFVLVNIGESHIAKPLPPALLALASTASAAPVKLEMELEDLPADDRTAFMQDLGLTSFSKEETLRRIFASMGRMVFFTVGEDECRAWPLHIGDDAIAAAAAIHTDLARRMVRAAVVGYDDFRRLGSIKEAKANGVHRLEGKTYVVQDGDVIEIL